MKEELKSLKDSAIQVASEKENLKKQKKFFNMKVEEQIELLGVEEIFNYNNDSYDAASLLMVHFSDIDELISKIKEQHSKYGNKKIKELVLETLKTMNYDIDYMGKVIDNYFMYQECGFNKVQTMEQNIEQNIELLQEEVKTTSTVIINETKETAKKVGTSIVNVAKPYGEVAKGQFNDAKVAATGLVNKGAKKLIKILQDVEKKTK